MQGTVVDKLVLELRAETSQLRKDLDGVKRQLKGAESSSKGLNISLRQVATALAAVGAAQIVGSIIQTTRTFEDLRATLKALTGSVEAADLSFKIIQDFTATTTFQLAGVTQGFITLLQAGITPTTDALKDFGNLAAAFDKDISVLAQAVFRAMTGEMEMLKQFNVVMKVEGDKFKATFNGVTQEVDRNGEAIAEYIRGISKANFPTAIEERANTLTGAISNLQDALDVFKAAIGEEIRPILIDLARDMTDFFNNAGDGAETIGTILAGAFQFLADTTRLLINNMDVLKGILIGMTSAMVLNGFIALTDLFVKLLNVARQTAKAEALILVLRTRGLALIGLGALMGGTLALVNKMLNDEDNDSISLKKDKNAQLQEEIANNERLQQLLTKTLSAQQLFTKSEMEMITTMQQLTKTSEKLETKLNRLFGFDLTQRTKRFNESIDDMRKVFADQRFIEEINRAPGQNQRFMEINPFDVDPFFFSNATKDFSLTMADSLNQSFINDFNDEFTPEHIAELLGFGGGKAKMVLKMVEENGKQVPKVIARVLREGTLNAITGEDLFAQYLGFENALDMQNFSENILPIGNVQTAISQFTKGVAGGITGAPSLGLGAGDPFAELKFLIDPKNQNSTIAFMDKMIAGGFLPASMKDDINHLQNFRNLLAEIIADGERSAHVLGDMAQALFDIADEAKNPTITFEDFTDEVLNNREQMAGFFEDIKKKYPEAFADLDEFISFAKQGVNSLRDTVKTSSELFSGEMLQAVVTATNQFTNQFVDALLTGQSALESFRSFAKNIVAQIISIFIQMAVVNKIINGIFGFKPGEEGYQPTMDVSDIFNRQTGGRVQRGQAYMVGETGAELFVPDMSGTVMNSHNTRSMGGGAPIIINQSLNFATGVQQTVRAEVMSLMPQITDASKNAVAEAAIRGGSFKRSLVG